MTLTLTTDGGASGAPVPGLANFRSTGEWPCTDGRIRAGVLFRADSPDALDADGAAVLRAHGISLTIDLRSTAEVADRGYALDGIDRVGHPIALLAPGEVHDTSITLASLYARLLAEHGPTLAAAVRSIAHHDGGALVHCTAGKDRTGVVIALTLLALGVDRRTVVADYAATHANLVGAWTEAYLARIPGRPALPAHLIEILNGSPASVLDELLDTLEREHGGARQYLLANGLTASDLDALRTRLVIPG